MFSENLHFKKKQSIILISNFFFDNITSQKVKRVTKKIVTLDLIWCKKENTNVKVDLIKNWENGHCI